MRIAHLTAGTGNFHCGNCHRDNALVRALRTQGHDAYLVPLYLPLVLDDEAAAPAAPLFAGGINMFLQQKLAVFRHTPRWMDRLFDATGLLRKAATFAGMTRARDLGEMTVEALRGLDGLQAKEWGRLVAWLESQKPDAVALSNGLLAGLARGIKDRLDCLVVSSLQGEDAFLDSLPEPWRTDAWKAMSACDAWIDRWIGVSDYYSDIMTARMNLPRGRIVTVRNGIDLTGLSPAPAPPATPVIGFLARLCQGKGLATLVDAFILLSQRGNLPGARLRIAGAKTSIDDKFIALQQEKLQRAGCSAAVEILPNIDAGEKVRFLQSLSVLSVPAAYGEAFGLFVIEALACGVPVVEPAHGAFPELIDATGGGVLCAPDDAPALATALEQLLLTPGLAAQLGRRGREAVMANFSADRMAREFAAVLESVTLSAPQVSSRAH